MGKGWARMGNSRKYGKLGIERVSMFGQGTTMEGGVSRKIKRALWKVMTQGVTKLHTYIFF